MTREEAIDKVLDEIQEDFLNVNLPLMEKMTLFAKTQNAVRYVADLPTEKAVPLSVIEKIRTRLHEDITYISDINGGWYELSEKGAIERVDNAIDQAIKECDTDDLHTV